MRKSETAAAPGLDPARETAVAGFLPFVFLRGGGGFRGQGGQRDGCPGMDYGERFGMCVFVSSRLAGSSMFGTGSIISLFYWARKLRLACAQYAHLHRLELPKLNIKDTLF